MPNTIPAAGEAVPAAGPQKATLSLVPAPMNPKPKRRKRVPSRITWSSFRSSATQRSRTNVCSRR